MEKIIGIEKRRENTGSSQKVKTKPYLVSYKVLLKCDVVKSIYQVPDLTFP